MPKILIVRLGAMGDVIHALPVVAALRNAMPDAHIGWAIEERWSELLCAKVFAPDAHLSDQKPLVNSIHFLNTKAWRKNIFASETRQQLSGLRHELLGQAYDIAIDLQGALKSAVITRASGARLRFGSDNPREAPAKLFYIGLPASGTHVIEQNLSLLQAAIPEVAPAPLPLAVIPSAFPLDPAAEYLMESALRSRSITKFAILNPGAGWAAKEWPAERYAEVTKELAKDGITCLVNIGPGKHDVTLAGNVKQESVGLVSGKYFLDKITDLHSGNAAWRFSCSIGHLISLTRRAALFIGGDTGPMHLAAALGVPVVAIFGPTDPARNGPYYQPHIVLRSPKSITSYSHVDTPDPGILSIREEEVTAAARKLLCDT